MLMRVLFPVYMVGCLVSDFVKYEEVMIVLYE